MPSFKECQQKRAQSLMEKVKTFCMNLFTAIVRFPSVFHLTSSFNVSLFPFLYTRFFSISSYIPEIISDWSNNILHSRWSTSNDMETMTHMKTVNTHLLVFNINASWIIHLLIFIHLQVTIDDSDEDIPVMKATRPPPRYVCFGPQSGSPDP